MDSVKLNFSVNYSDLTTTYSDKLELETTGRKVITLKELNCHIDSVLNDVRKKLKDATVYKNFKSPIHYEEELDQEWELY